MRKVRDISVDPEPIGTIVITAFVVTGYDKDCDGGLMARLQHIDFEGRPSGWEQDCIGLSPDAERVVTLDEWRNLE